MAASPPLFPQADTAHNRILEGLRAQILAGNFAPGTRLPPVRELAANWKASVFTLQTVLGVLSKEGWLQLRHGSGTYITDPRKRFICAGIYQSWDLAETGTSAFTRNLHFALLRRLELLEKEVQVFTDSRPDEQQTQVMPALADAIRQRRIQCVISPTTNKFNARPLAELAIPTAFLSNTLSTHLADYNAMTMVPEAIRFLAVEGCRSVGIISTVTETPKPDPLANYYALFETAARDSGLASRKEWIRRPRTHIPTHELYGYREFRKLWRLPRRPEGLVVYPDSAVQGTILAILEIGVREVTRKMRFVFHRNAHVPILCPFRATWAISDEDVLADALVDVVQRQLRGEPVSPVLLPYLFKTLKSSM